MAQPIELVEASVKWPALKPIQTQYGDRINAVAVTDWGEEIKLWGKPGDTAIASLKRGQRVTLARDQKGYRLASTPATDTTQSKARKAFDPWSDEEKRQIAAKAKDHAALLGYCLKLAKDELSEYAHTSEDLRSLGITIYLSALKN